MGLRVKPLASRLRSRRDALHLSQTEAAQLVGVSHRTWQNWEAGTSRPRPKHRRAIEVFLNGEAA